MAIPTDYWTTFINIDNNDMDHHNLRDFGTPITPDGMSANLFPDFIVSAFFGIPVYFVFLPSVLVLVKKKMQMPQLARL